MKIQEVSISLSPIDLCIPHKAPRLRTLEGTCLKRRPKWHVIVAHFYGFGADGHGVRSSIVITRPATAEVGGATEGVGGYRALCGDYSASIVGECVVWIAVSTKCYYRKCDDVVREAQSGQEKKEERGEPHFECTVYTRTLNCCRL